MAGDLRAEEASWLDEHLAGCAACTTVASQYAADRDALRALRDQAPEPPRDLWARTSSAIEREAGASGSPRSERASRVPLGALSGIAVIVVVIGVSTLSGVITPLGTTPTDKPIDQSSTTGGEAGSGPSVALATPFSVGAGEVAWVDMDASGRLAYNNATVDEVCPAGDTSGCARVRDAEQQPVGITTRPHTILESPTGGQDVAIADNGAGGDEIILFDLPDTTPTPEPGATPTPTPAPPTATASVAPTSASPIPSAEASPTASPIDTSGPTPSPTPVLPSPPPSPTLSPTPSIAATIAIASGIELIGESAAFSPDGSWFAFTARPEDGTRGPDVYVWRVGETAARPLTTDGSTVFASWDGNRVVASRPDDPTPSAPTGPAVTVRIDPSTGAETPAGDMWRPVVDPTRSRAIGWTGSLARSADGTWAPGEGRLELRDWTVRGAGNQGTGRGLVIADAASAGFDVRWDEAGDWVAIWVADGADPKVGRLSLYRVDAARGELERAKDAPTDAPALPGFSIGKGRLAWATPPGQDGEGSRVQIVAWNEDGVGSIESAPGEDVVVIR